MSPYLFGVIYVALIGSIAVRVQLLTVYHVPFPWLTYGFYTVALGLLHLQFARLRTAKQEQAALNG